MISPSLHACAAVFLCSLRPLQSAAEGLLPARPYAASSPFQAPFRPVSMIATSTKKAPQTTGAVLLFSCAGVFSSRPGPLLCTTDTPDASQHSSLRGSVAWGSCDIRSPLCSVRSHGSAAATPFIVHDDSGSDTHLAPSEEPGSHAARSPDTDHANDPPSDGESKSSELFLSTLCSIVLSKLRSVPGRFNQLFSS